MEESFNCEHSKIPLLVVAGPTAGGKTALAVRLALRLGGEIVSADSMQIYRGMEIATAKPTAEELAAVRHHLIGVIDPAVRFSVAQYAPMAHAVIRDIHDRGRLPILCGGTGLYVEAVTAHLSYAGPAAERLSERRATGALYEELRRLDPGVVVQPNDRKRILRALELYYTAGMTIAEQNARSRQIPSPYSCHMLFLHARERQSLYDRIERRVDAMFCRGLLEEAARWRALAGTATAAQAIGYKELEPYFRGECTLEEAAARLKQETRRYAKRQLSWFRRMAVQWNARAPGSCTELFLEDDLDGWTAENAEGLAYMDIDKERQ